MSNRRRPKMTPAQRLAAKRAVRCPDCRSDVELRGRRVEVRHDDGCPALAILAGRGLTDSAMIVSRNGSTASVRLGQIGGIPAIGILGATPYERLYDG
ncbi:hypothetical protein Val02_26930 [Virgisporangium aliadipatigenens]|uniref:Uncharacterized protein n=1 Tax=Virgisporangium aliadipatigenens TaxID=741659 RepID=A0A8J4DQY7_9ACTN|nr:hypothetical protein [Virgisporangium aliadipatigenens]GIJ45807.1 hypothetical protein Val02_26930 [Virgisporangium aliadipatigenens]